MKKKKLSSIILLIFSISPIIVFLALYNVLPDKVPMHFNFEGEVDRYGSKIELLIIAILPMAISGLFYIIPKIDPKGENYKKFTGFYDGFKIVMVIFMNVIFYLMISSGLGDFALNMETIVPILVGSLLVFIGNYLPKAKQNFTFGIKTPWTLSSEEVWDKTHRIGGVSFVIGGILIIASGILPKNEITIILFVGALLIAALFPIVMSYVYYKRTK